MVDDNVNSNAEAEHTHRRYFGDLLVVVERARPGARRSFLEAR